MVYKIVTTKRFDKDYAKLSPTDRNLAKQIINRLANDEVLEQFFLSEWLDSGEFERTISRIRNKTV